MITYDLEANGLYEDASEVHCIIIKHNKDIYRLYDTNNIYIEQRPTDLLLNTNNILDIFNLDDPNEKIICHNQFGYDIWMLRKFFNIDLIDLFGYKRLVDTYVWSQALNPDRELPRGCPNIIKMEDGTSKRIGPHGLDSYGYRLNRLKPKISDWRVFDNSILNRCEEDVLINEGTYFYLCKERGDL